MHHEVEEEPMQKTLVAEDTQALGSHLTTLDLKAEQNFKSFPYLMR